MAGHWRDDKPKRRTLSPRAQRVADEIQARAMELRDNSEEGLSIREAVALAAVQLGMAPDANAEVRQDARFWDNVKKLRNGCWEWQGTLTSGGYGRFDIEGRTVSAHRYAYESRIGPIPPRLVIDHLCRNPPCVRPDHLEPVTTIQNTLRGDAPWARWVRGEIDSIPSPGIGSTKKQRKRRPAEGGTCDASIVGPNGALLGPCVLRHQHDGPVHQDATGARWAATGS